MDRTMHQDVNNQIGEEVEVTGWIHSIRSHGNVTFIDLRDKSGLLQIVVDPEDISKVEQLRKEWVVQIKGKVTERPDDMINEDIITGETELQANAIEVLSKSKTPPFDITDNGKDINETIRMEYRYLDLRRERMKNNLQVRHQVSHYFRDFLNQQDFIEVETPILTKSTPEGARDFLVPARKQPGAFYALPQSPQQYKQLLMVSGIERYFQFARCFRDEDVRADRQAEFTQLDLEVSFMEQKDFLDMIETMFIELIEKLFPNKTIQEKPFPRIPYNEAMEKWDSDRPDLRNNKEDSDELAFAFIVDFPMFEKTDEGWSCEHHPFTKPQTNNPERLKENPEDILAHQYDLVLNGEEIGGGSLRNYDRDMLKSIFKILGHNQTQIENKFGHLLEAFEYGAPPHGGIAFGFERLLMILLDEDNIREVMAFPKTGDGRGLMMDTPSKDINDQQLDELHINVDSEDEE